MKHHNYFETFMCTLWPKVTSKLKKFKQIGFSKGQCLQPVSKIDLYQTNFLTKVSILKLSCTNLLNKNYQLVKVS